MSSSLPCWRWRNRTAVYFISFELIASKQGCDVTGGGSWTFPWGQDNGFARGNPPTKWGGRFYVHLNFPKTSLAITNGHVFQVELRLSRWILWWVLVGVPASACPPPSTRSTWGWGTTTRTASLSISTRWSTALRRGYRQRKRCRVLLFCQLIKVISLIYSGRCLFTARPACLALLLSWLPSLCSRGSTRLQKIQLYCCRYQEEGFVHKNPDLESFFLYCILLTAFKDTGRWIRERANKKQMYISQIWSSTVAGKGSRIKLKIKEFEKNDQRLNLLSNPHWGIGIAGLDRKSMAGPQIVASYFQTQGPFSVWCPWYNQESETVSASKSKTSPRPPCDSTEGRAGC